MKTMKKLESGHKTEPNISFIVATKMKNDSKSQILLIADPRYKINCVITTFFSSKRFYIETKQFKIGSKDAKGKYVNSYDLKNDVLQMITNQKVYCCWCFACFSETNEFQN